MGSVTPEMPIQIYKFWAKKTQLRTWPEAQHPGASKSSANLAVSQIFNVSISATAGQLRRSGEPQRALNQRAHSGSADQGAVGWIQAVDLFCLGLHAIVVLLGGMPLVLRGRVAAITPSRERRPGTTDGRLVWLRGRATRLHILTCCFPTRYCRETVEPDRRIHATMRH